MARAAFRYNHSDYYVQLVLSFQAGYQTGVFAVPSPPPPPADEGEAKAQAKRAQGRGTSQAHDDHEAGRARSRRPQPTPKPAPKPAPKPDPEADTQAHSQAQPQPLAGAQARAGRRHLDRPAGRRSASAAPCWTSARMNGWGDRADADFDGDGATSRPTARSSPGWSASTSTLQVERSGGDLRRLRDRRPRLPQRRRVLRPRAGPSAAPTPRPDRTDRRRRRPGRGTMSPCPSTSRTPPSRRSAWSGSSRSSTSSPATWSTPPPSCSTWCPRATAPQPRIHKELLRNTVELTTGICRTTDEAIDELAALIDLVRPLRRRARASTSTPPAPTRSPSGPTSC